MNLEKSVPYTVYDLTARFSRQPREMRACPRCGNSLVIASIKPSHCVAMELSDPHLIPVHGFSRLLKCSACHWWAIRESWTLCEWGKEYDFLIVGETAGTGLENTDQRALPWSKALEDEHLYRSVLRLPENLARLFENDET